MRAPVPADGGDPGRQVSASRCRSADRALAPPLRIRPSAQAAGWRDSSGLRSIGGFCNASMARAKHMALLLRNGTKGFARRRHSAFTLRQA